MNGTQATKECLMGGTDIDSGGTYRANMFSAIVDGELDEKYARLALTNSYKMRSVVGGIGIIICDPFQLGSFPPGPSL